MHNANAVNFELASAPLDTPGHEHWTTLIPGDDDSRLLGVDAFAGHVVVFRRRDALTELAVMRRTDGRLRHTGGDRVRRADLHRLAGLERRSGRHSSYRLGYTSLVTPSTVYDYQLDSRELVLRKQQPVLGGVDLGAYTQYREWAQAPDGERVPISLVARKDVPRDGDAPVVLYGYGSYEASMDPWFSIAAAVAAGPRRGLRDRARPRRR